MKEIEIDLSESFERVLEAVLALPNRSLSGARDHCAGEKELRQAIRGLYEAANGRQVETGIGLIPIAPPIAPFLKAMPFRASTLIDFLVAAAAQIVSLPSMATAEVPPRSSRTDPGNKEPRPALRLKKQPIRVRSVSRVSPANPRDFLTPQMTAAHHD